MPTMNNAVLPLLAVLGGTLLAGCPMLNANTLEVREILLYGQGGSGFNERHGVFFGDPEAIPDTKLGGLDLKFAKPLPAQPNAGGGATGGVSSSAITVTPLDSKLTVAGSLWVNGQPSLVLPLRGISDRFTLSTVPVSDDVVVESRAGLEAVVYFNGGRWFSVTGPMNGDRKTRFTPRPRNGLRGLAGLSDREADGLAAYLQAKAKGSVAVAVLASETISESAWNFEPRPLDYKRSALAVQFGVPTDLFGGFTPGNFSYKELYGGGGSAYNDSDPMLRLDDTQGEFNQTWNIINGNQLPLPTAPVLDFKSIQVLTLFIGQRATGGYGVALRDAQLNGQTLTVNVTLVAPRPGSFTTQAITSPYLSLSVTGDIAQVRVVDQNGLTVATLRK
jgi:hypothetical protein